MTSSSASTSTPDAKPNAYEGWAVAIRRADGTSFLACSHPGYLPAIWPKWHRRHAVRHKRELLKEGFTCRVVPVVYHDPFEVPTVRQHKWSRPSVDR